MIFGQQSSARTALWWPSRPQRLICSRRRSYIPATVTVSIMPLDIFIQKLPSVFLADSTMHSHFSFKIRKVPRVYHQCLLVQFQNSACETFSRKSHKRCPKSVNIKVFKECLCEFKQFRAQAVLALIACAGSAAGHVTWSLPS